MMMANQRCADIVGMVYLAADMIVVEVGGCVLASCHAPHALADGAMRLMSYLGGLGSVVNAAQECGSRRAAYLGSNRLGLPKAVVL